ncbi:tRNA threonylcarbamoyladenosine dehydratase [Magnetococcales bacterium HHB-1]
MAVPEPFERTHILVGDEGLEKLKSAHVLLCGLGGVGGFAAEALGRVGVGRLSLVDNDVVAPTNINRQLIATLNSVGDKKVKLMGERLSEINPECQLDLYDLFLTPENIPTLLEELKPDWVADAIDTLNCKVNLLVESLKNDTPVISSMGAGGRLNPTSVAVDDLMDTHTCPLARVVRLRLRRRGYQRGVTAVWSSEKARPHLPPEPTETGRPRAVNGTVSYMPALFGLTMAGVIIENIVNS